MSVNMSLTILKHCNHIENPWPFAVFSKIRSFIHIHKYSLMKQLSCMESLATNLKKDTDPAFK